MSIHFHRIILRTALGLSVLGLGGCLPSGGIKEVGRSPAAGAGLGLIGGALPQAPGPKKPDDFKLENSVNDGGTGSELVFDSASQAWKIAHEFIEADSQNFIFKPIDTDSTVTAQLTAVNSGCSSFVILNPFGGLNTPSVTITGTTNNPIQLNITPDLNKIASGQTVECRFDLLIEQSKVQIISKYKKPANTPIPTATPTPTVTPTPSPTPGFYLPPPTYPDDWVGKSSCSVQELWGLKQIQAPNAWTIHSDCLITKIGIIDTGADFNHPDLKNNLSPGLTYYANGTLVQGQIGQESCPGGTCHGTHVAGTIGAEGNNGMGISGVCQAAEMIPMNVFYQSANQYNIVNAIDQLGQQNVKVINFSLGSNIPRFGCWPTDPATCPANNPYYAVYKFYEAAAARHPGVLFVIAAGNDGHCLDRNCPKYGNLDPDTGSPLADLPLTTNNVISVSAGDPGYRIAPFSNFARHVEIAAPGINVCSTQPNTQYLNMAGTSMAAPHVAGVAAMIHSFYLGNRNMLLDGITLKHELLKLSNKNAMTNPKNNSKVHGLAVGGIGQ